MLNTYHPCAAQYAIKIVGKIHLGISFIGRIVLVCFLRMIDAIE
jgi:hypothetical protein